MLKLSPEQHQLLTEQLRKTMVTDSPSTGTGLGFMIGQREFSAVMFMIISIIAVVAGLTPDTAADWLLGVIAPMTGLVVAFKYLIDSIQNNVRAQVLTPGSFLELFKTHEFAWALATGVVFILQRFLGTVITDTEQQTLMQVVSGMVMLLSTTLLASFAKRASGAEDFVQEPAR